MTNPAIDIDRRHTDFQTGKVIGEAFRGMLGSDADPKIVTAFAGKLAVFYDDTVHGHKHPEFPEAVAQGLMHGFGDSHSFQELITEGRLAGERT